MALLEVAAHGEGYGKAMEEIKFFRTYWNGMELVAMVEKSWAGGYSLSVDCIVDGQHHPHFHHVYKDQRGAIRAMNTRFRGAEWQPI